MDANKILEFIGSGYRFTDSRPADGTKVKVITNQLNVFKARYDNLLGRHIFEESGDFEFKPGEEVIAWKYIPRKK